MLEQAAANLINVLAWILAGVAVLGFGAVVLVGVAAVIDVFAPWPKDEGDR
jgi:hypothetical protein